MEAQSLISRQLSWWFICFSQSEKLAGSHNKKKIKSDFRLYNFCSG
ncbi:hypothetical protein HMPREF9176_1240 [Streptococcus downei F0415]|nr:hypothetical protein HMPREF9176_1240 [Streptococcus downei F0415]